MGRLAHVAVEQFERAGADLDGVLGLDGARIGGVRPGEPPVDIARPDGMGDRVEHGADRAELVQEFGMAFAQSHQLQAVARHVADAHHRAAGDGAPFDLEMAPARAGDRDRKTLAAFAQPLDRLIHLLREVRRQPGAKPSTRRGKGASVTSE